MANLRIGRRSGLVFRGGRQRRESMWLGGVYTETQLGAASTAALITSLNAAALALRPFTIVRSRGYIHVNSDQQSAAEDWGCVYTEEVVSDQASAIGISAVPTGDTDRGSDLFYVFEEVIGFFAFTTGVAFIEQGKGWQFDSKAMRKVNDDQDVISVIETQAGVSSAVVRVATRFLIKLH